MRRKDTLLFFLLFLFVLPLNVIYAQNTGRIQGVVTDSITSDPLFGANVWLKGYSLGSASDMEGRYVISKIPSGSYILTVRYIGYQEKEIPVEIQGGTDLTLDVSLTGEIIEGEVVIVTGQALGQREAINTQLTSNTIINVVSAEKIHQLPDADAATALSRLPGLSLMNGDQIVIRGLQAKQNLVLVNGIQLPSTDIDTRATNLGFISSNMLSGIEVVKVLTPDMDANAIGGVVNLRLREAPSDFHFDMLSQGSLNHQDRTLDNYRFWASASDRFFDDKLGVFLQGNADRSNAGNDLATAAYTSYESRPYGLAPYRMDNFTFNDQQNVTSTAGGSLILDYKFPNGSILLQNTVSQAIYDNATHNYQLDFASNRIVYSLGRDKNDKILIINGLQTQYNFGDIKGELSLSHSYSDKNTDVRFGDVGDATNFTYADGPLPFLDANSNHISYSGAVRNTLTYDDALNIITDPEDYKGAKIQDWAVLRSEVFDEHIYNSKLDFTIPVSFSKEFSSIFKVGGKFTRTTRVNDLTRWYKRVGDETFYDNVRDFIPGKVLTGDDPLLFTDLQNNDYTRGKYFLDETYDFKYAYDIDKTSDFYAALKLPLHRAGSAQYDFSGAEIFTAGYLMGSFSIGPRLSLIAGGRYEYYNMNYHSTMFYVTHPVDGNGNLIDTLNSVDRNDNNFFPNAQLRYKFTDWADIRLAYSQTVSRPDYKAILPNTFFNERILTQAGNPKLKPAIATNYDAYLSFYNNEIGLFTVGGFYKEMEDVFFETIIYYGNLSYYNVTFPDSAFWESQGIRPPGRSEKVTTYLNNPNPAYIRGLEVEWQTNFWYLPQPLNSLVLSINYTRVWSKMDYQQLRTQPVRNPQTGQIVDYITTDTVRTARLLNQGDNILNIALGVDYKGFSGRISFNLQGNVITKVGARPEDDEFTGNIYKWDFTLKQNLPLEGLSIQLSGINIFHNVTEKYRKFSRVLDGPISDNLLSREYSPRVFELNLRYNL
jgi:TonB-dependent receptor